MTFIEKLNKKYVNDDTNEEKEIILKFLENAHLKEKIIENTNNDDIYAEFIKFIRKYFAKRIEISKILINFLDDIPISDMLRENSGPKKIFADYELRVELFKYFQGDKNHRKTQEQIANDLYYSTNSIQNALNEIKNPDYTMLGTKMHISSRNPNGYYNMNTLTPIFMGLQLGEIYMLLKKLLSDDSIYSEVYVTFSQQIYNQLSNYGKKIIKNALERDNLFSKLGFTDSIINSMSIEEKDLNSLDALICRIAKTENCKVYDRERNIYEGTVYRDNSHICIQTNLGEKRLKLSDIISIEVEDEKYKAEDLKQ